MITRVLKRGSRKFKVREGAVMTKAKSQNPRKTWRCYFDGFKDGGSCHELRHASHFESWKR